MSRRMIFVLAVSALAGLCITFLLEDKHTPRPAGTVSAPPAGLGQNPADDMASAIRKAIEGDKPR